MKRPNRKQHGAAIIAALVLLTVIVITFGAMLQQLAATQRAARTAGRKLQAQWLAESALERAIAKHGADPKYDRVEFRYNRLGQVSERKDQLQTIHAYDYDKLGRLSQDRVTAFGAGVDQTVKRIGRT